MPYSITILYTIYCILYYILECSVYYIVHETIIARGTVSARDPRPLRFREAAPMRPRVCRREVRPISLLRFLGSTFPGNPLLAGELRRSK